MALNFSVIGTFQDNISAGMKSINSNTAKTNKTLGGMKKTLMGVAGAMGLAFGASAAIKGIKSMTSDVIQLGDNIDKASQRVNLSIESYQAWGHVMKLNGTTIESVETGLKRFSVNIVDAASGTGLAADSFANLQIQLKQADGSFRETDDIFTETVKKLADMEDITLRNATAMKIFGKTGGNLAPLLNAGSDAIDEQLGELDKLGIVLSKDQVKAAAEFNDTMERVNKTITSMKFDIMIPVLEKLDGIFSGMLESGELKQRMDDLAETVSNLYETITTITEFISDNFIPLAIGALIALIPVLIGWVTSLTASFVALDAAMLANPFGLAALAVVALGVAIVQTKKNYDELNEAMKGSVAITTEDRARREELVEAQKALVEAIGNTIEAGDNEAVAISKVTKEWEAAKSIAVELGLVLEGDVANQLKQVTTFSAAASQATFDLSGNLVQVGGVAKKTSEAVKTLSISALELKNSLFSLSMSSKEFFKNIKSIREGAGGAFDALNDQLTMVKRNLEQLADNETSQSLKDIWNTYNDGMIAATDGHQELMNSFRTYIDAADTLVDESKAKQLAATLELAKAHEMANDKDRAGAIEIAEEKIALADEELAQSQAKYDALKEQDKEFHAASIELVRATQEELELIKEGSLANYNETVLSILEEQAELERQIEEEKFLDFGTLYENDVERRKKALEKELKAVAGNAEAEAAIRKKYQKKEELDQIKTQKKTSEDTAAALSSITGMWANYFAARAEQEKDAYGKSTATSKSYGNMYKAMAITQTIIDTASAAMSAFKAMSGIAVVGPALGAVAAAATVAMGAVQVASIASQSFAAGGFPTGANAQVTVNENGQEAILNARATASLGRENIDVLNEGGGVGTQVSISPSIVIQGNADESVVSAIGDELDNFARKIESVFELGIIDSSRVQMAFA